MHARGLYVLFALISSYVSCVLYFCVLVSLFACICHKLHVQISRKLLYVLPVAVAWSFLMRVCTSGFVGDVCSVTLV